MKKTSVALILSFIIGLMPVIAKGAEAPIIKNSTFDSDMVGWSASSSSALSLDKGQNHSSAPGGSLKGAFSTGQYLDFMVDADMTPGGKYVISFWAKSDTEGTRFQVIRIHGGGWNYFDTVTLTTSWEKYTMPVTNPAVNQQGTQVDQTGCLHFRILDKATVWLDEVYVTDPSVIEEDTSGYVPEYYEPYYHQSAEKDQIIKGFDDTKGHWAEDVISMLKTDGAVNGVGNNFYEPDRSITRAEFLSLITKHLNIEDTPYTGEFSDVSASDWFAPVIETAYQLGLISPVLTIGGKFRPREAITREDACVLMMSFAEYNKIKDKRESFRFSDHDRFSDYARESANSAYKKEIINGYEDQSFRPGGKLSRAEAAQLLANLINANGLLYVYVDGAKGNDIAPGTKSEPVKTIQKAQQMARLANSDMKNNIYIFIKGGEYFLSEPLSFSPVDSGTNGCSVIYTSYDGEAVLSGGKHIQPAWISDNPDLGIYKTYIGTDIKTRQMFVDGLRMTRARSEGGFNTGKGYSGINSSESGYITGDAYFKDFKDISDMEAVYYKDWTNPRCGVESFTDNGDGTYTMTMRRPGWTLLMNKAHLKVSNPRYFENQYEFVDKPGEWYLDRAGWLYFIPYDFIDLENADIVLPVTERLINVTGSKDQRVENIAFSGLSFKYVTWMEPSSANGYSDAQGGRIRDNGDRVPDSAVWIKYTKNVAVNDCVFSKLGLTALNVTDWVEDVKITGNHIYDISGCGMYVGNHGTAGGAAGDAYLSKNITIRNNLVHDYGIDYGSSDGIEGMTMSYADVSHNEIYNSRYSGLVLGYGAQGTRYDINYTYNYIHDILNENIYDGGSIYVTQPTGGTEDKYNQIAYNYCSNQGNETGVLYADNNSTFWEIHHNVVNQVRTPYWYYDRREDPKLFFWYMSNARSDCKLHSNYTTSDNLQLSGVYTEGDEPDTEIGENYVYPDADWPDEAKSIIGNAGLEPEYLKKYPTGIQSVELTERSINLDMDKSVNVMDYIRAYGRKDQPMDTSDLSVVCSTNMPDALKISPDGTVTSIGTGKAILNITVINGDLRYEKELIVYSGDGFDKVEFNRSDVQIYLGKTATLSAKGKSKIGRELEVQSVKYESLDPSVAVVSEDGVITGTGEGTTNIRATAMCEGNEREVLIPVTVKEKAEALGINDFLITDWNSILEDPELWLKGDSKDIINKIDNGLSISTPANTVGTPEMYGDELIKTKIRIEATGGWPSIAVRAASNVLAYGKNTEYMVTFGQGNLSLQKFNDGERRIFDDATVDCDFEYGKDYEIHIGAVNHDDCVEIIVAIDGVPYMRYKDYDENRITDAGYAQIYCRSGSFVLMPTK